MKVAARVFGFTVAAAITLAPSAARCDQSCVAHPPDPGAYTQVQTFSCVDGEPACDGDGARNGRCAIDLCVVCENDPPLNVPITSFCEDNNPPVVPDIHIVIRRHKRKAVPRIRHFRNPPITAIIRCLRGEPCTRDADCADDNPCTFDRCLPTRICRHECVCSGPTSECHPGP